MTLFYTFEITKLIEVTSEQLNCEKQFQEFA